MEFPLDILIVVESGIQSVLSKSVHIRDDHVVSVYVDSFGYVRTYTHCTYTEYAHWISPTAYHCRSYMQNMRIFTS